MIYQLMFFLRMPLALPESIMYLLIMYLMIHIKIQFKIWKIGLHNLNLDLVTKRVMRL